MEYEVNFGAKNENDNASVQETFEDRYIKYQKYTKRDIGCK